MGREALYTAYDLSPVQQRVKDDGVAGKFGRSPKTCVVTGGTGFVGQRLVEMLVERGAKRVVSFDIVPPAENVWHHEAIQYVVGDLRKLEDVERAVAGADCVWHNGAAVGPFHPTPLYHSVNVVGTENVIAACRKHGVKKLVFSSSPSTRFQWNVEPDGFTEADLAPIPQKTYVQEYAKTKAEAELLVTAACCDELLTVSVAPHQVYGPRDNLFLPNTLEVASLGKLRIFGDGQNRICMTHVDNYAHGLWLGEKALYPGSPALGKFYITTDGSTHPDSRGCAMLWDILDDAVVKMGFKSLKEKAHLPVWLLMTLGLLCDLFGALTGTKPKLSRFSVKMMIMNRWFRIQNAERDLGYEPVVHFGEGWEDCIQWFRKRWLPLYAEKSSGLTGSVAQQSQRKIDIQAGKQATGGGSKHD